MRSVLVITAWIIAVALLIDLSPAGALPPSPDTGAELAARWCADCHMPAADTPRRDDVAPSFHAIAVNRSAEQIRDSLSKPHAKPMGGIALNRREVEDVTAYIKGLGD